MTAAASISEPPTNELTSTAVSEAELFGMIPFNYDLSERELAICLGMCVVRYLQRLPRLYNVQSAFTWGWQQGWIVAGSQPGHYCLRHPLSPHGFNCGATYQPPAAPTA